MRKQGSLPQGSASKSGLVMSPDGSGYAVDWTELPSSDHFFLATHCSVKREITGVRLLFGASSSFEESEHYDLAVEVHIPIHEAQIYLHRSVFVEVSANGNATFYDSVKQSLQKLQINLDHLKPEKPKKMPLNRNAAFRIFPANFVAISYAGTQALVEFFEVTPELIHFVTKRTKLRPFAGVKPVISVILDTAVLFTFMELCRPLVDQPTLEKRV